MDRLPLILICDDDLTFHLAVKHATKGKYDCRSAHNGDEALTIIQKYPIDLVLLDVQMRTKDEGLRYIPLLKDADEDLSIIMISGLTDFATVREAMRLGACDYVPKDFDPNELLHTVAKVLERSSLLKRNQQHSFEVQTVQRQHTLIGNSKHIQALRKTIERIRTSNANVVITGETGTGKEVVARQLRGTLPDGSLAPFVAVDSATIQSSTAESLLFGHEKGSFTGADKTTKGIFEEANEGIVYFDEIANMPLGIQAKLLRVLQEKEVVRLGSSKTIQLEFRVVCASNKNLDEMVLDGLFKDDLLQRLNVLPLSLTPLKDRTEDIPDLIQHLLVRHAGTNPLCFTNAAMDVLKRYSWPGNIRELGNVVAYVVAMTEGTEVDVVDLPPKIRDAARNPSSENGTDRTFYKRVEEFEKDILTDEYSRAGGNISRLALSLGMDRSHLYSKLRQYSLHSGRSSEKNAQRN